MAWVNSIELSGRVVRDAKRGNNGPWRFTLKQSGGRKRNGDGYHPDEFFPVACWHDAGEEVKAGQEISVKGRLRHERWIDADGGQRERLTVIAESIQLSDQPDPAPPEAPPRAAAPPITPRYEIPSHPVRQVKVAAARPVTPQDPITNDDIPW